MGLHESNSHPRHTLLVRWWLPATIILIALILMLGGDVMREALRFDRVWVTHGENWRWLSGHLIHLGWSHFALNAAGLLLVWYLVGDRYAAGVWLVNIVVIMLVIDAGFWFLNPGLHWYVGLSGMLHGLLVAGIVARLYPFDAETAVLASLLIAKLVWEQVSGPIPGSEITSGGPVIVDAHLYGALGGVLAALLARIRVRQHASI